MQGGGVQVCRTPPFPKPHPSASTSTATSSSTSTSPNQAPTPPPKPSLSSSASSTSPSGGSAIRPSSPSSASSVPPTQLSSSSPGMSLVAPSTGGVGGASPKPMRPPRPARATDKPRNGDLSPIEGHLPSSSLSSSLSHRKPPPPIPTSSSGSGSAISSSFASASTNSSTSNSLVPASAHASHRRTPSNPSAPSPLAISSSSPSGSSIQSNAFSSSSSSSSSAPTSPSLSGSSLSAALANRPKVLPTKSLTVGNNLSGQTPLARSSPPLSRPVSVFHPAATPFSTSPTGSPPAGSSSPNAIRPQSTRVPVPSSSSAGDVTSSSGPPMRPPRPQSYGKTSTAYRAPPPQVSGSAITLVSRPSMAGSSILPSRPAPPPPNATSQLSSSAAPASTSTSTSPSTQTQSQLAASAPPATSNGTGSAPVGIIPVPSLATLMSTSPKQIARSLSAYNLKPQASEPAAGTPGQAGDGKSRVNDSTRRGTFIFFKPNSGQDVSPFPGVPLHTSKDNKKKDKKEIKSSKGQGKAKEASTAPYEFKGVFGATLQEVADFERQRYAILFSGQTAPSVPIILNAMTDAVVEFGGCNLEGLFRVPGKQTDKDALMAKLNKGDYEIPKDVDPHIIAALLKYWLMRLREPVIPGEYFVRCRSVQTPEEAAQLVEELPILNRLVLNHVLCFLNDKLLRPEVVSKTKMNEESIATAFGPCFLCLDETGGNNIEEMMSIMKIQKQFVSLLLRYTASKPLNVTSPGAGRASSPSSYLGSSASAASTSGSPSAGHDDPKGLKRTISSRFKQFQQQAKAKSQAGHRIRMDRRMRVSDAVKEAKVSDDEAEDYKYSHK